MGIVFLGRSPGGRHVAVKAINAYYLNDPDLRSRFWNEVAAARQVSGLFTAAVVDADVDSKTLWLATAFVPGPSLAQAVAAYGPLPADSLVPLFTGLAEGLQAIHAAGVVHRDLKPANVMLDRDGPRVIDFGISQVSTGFNFDTARSDGLMAGTPGYMAPEVRYGGEIGPKSDIFNLGMVMAFAATGTERWNRIIGLDSTKPIIGLDSTSIDLPSHFLQDSTFGSALHIRDVPETIRPLVIRCLAASPEGRPSPAELLAALGADADLGPGWLPAPWLGSAVAVPPTADVGVLLFRIYIPADSLFAAQHAELLSLFHDWLSVRWPGIRRSGYRTAAGEVIEFFAEAHVTPPPMGREYDVFRDFLRLCEADPDAAADFLAEAGMARSTSAKLVARFGKKILRLQADVRHEHERLSMELRHRLEDELMAADLDLRSLPPGMIDSLLNDWVPDSLGQSLPVPDAPPALSGQGAQAPTVTAAVDPADGGHRDRVPPPVITIQLQQGNSHAPPPAVTVSIGQVINTMAYTVHESVQGTLNYAPQARELLSLIERFAPQNDTDNLRTAVHELEDREAPPSARSAAKGKLRAFISTLGGKLSDAAIAILVSYTETRLRG
jgi:Protein kinase domain